MTAIRLDWPTYFFSFLLMITCLCTLCHYSHLGSKLCVLEALLNPVAQVPHLWPWTLIHWPFQECWCTDAFDQNEDSLPNHLLSVVKRSPFVFVRVVSIWSSRSNNEMPTWGVHLGVAVSIAPEMLCMPPVQLSLCICRPLCCQCGSSCVLECSASGPQPCAHAQQGKWQE